MSTIAPAILALSGVLIVCVIAFIVWLFAQDDSTDG